MGPHLIEKQLNILDYALSSLWRRRLKNGAVLLIFSLVIFLLASFHMVTSALIERGQAILAHAPEITVQRMSAGRQEAMPLSYASSLSEIFGIRKIVPRIWGYYFDEVQEANYTVMGLDVQQMPHGAQLGLALAGGRTPEFTEAGTAVIGSSVKKVLNLQGRSVFSLFRPDLSLKTFKVEDSFSPATDIMTHDMLLMGLEDARDLFAIPEDAVTDFAVFVANASEIDTIARKIAELLPDARVLTRSQILKTYQVVFGWRSGFASVCLLSALAAFIILAWDKASGLSPEERREIAILKILGWQTADVLKVRFWESLVVSGLAFVFGCTLAFIHVTLGQASLFRPVLMGWSVLQPDLHLVPDLAVGDFLLLFSFSVLPYLAATVIPAWRSASVPADSVLG